MYNIYLQLVLRVVYKKTITIKGCVNNLILKITEIWHLSDSSASTLTKLVMVQQTRLAPEDTT